MCSGAACIQGRPWHIRSEIPAILFPKFLFPPLKNYIDGENNSKRAATVNGFDVIKLD